MLALVSHVNEGQIKSLRQAYSGLWHTGCRDTMPFLQMPFPPAVFYCVCVKMYSIVNWQAVMWCSHGTT